jgi:hypothetical protein
MSAVTHIRPRVYGAVQKTTAHPQLASPAAAFIAVLAAAAGAGLVGMVPSVLDAAHADPSGLAAFAVATIVFQLLAVRSHGVGGEAVSAIGILACGFVFGPGPATAIAALAAVVQWVSSRGLLHRAIFDASGFALSALAGSAVYHALGGNHWTPVDEFAAAAAAGIAYKVVNVGLLCQVMALAESRRMRDVWNERFRWARYYYLAFGPLALGSAAAYDQIGLIGFVAFSLPPVLVSLSVRQYVERTRESFERVQQANDELRATHAELEAAHDRARRMHLETIAALSRAIEAKDDYTGGHVERVSTVAVALAERLGCSPDEVDAVEIGAVLHDIGKIGIPESILQKDGPLDDGEWALMKRHPLISEQILTGLDLHPFVGQIVRSSHERIDGKGYPDGLASESVPLAARIVLVADAFDALTSHRPYRPARPVDDALREVQANAGTQFCPQVVAALEEIRRTAPGLLEAGELTALAS